MGDAAQERRVNIDWLIEKIVSQIPTLRREKQV